MLPKRPRVLLAEDHPEVAKAVCRVLSLDCEVVGTVADGSAVLDAAQRLQPDVIVLDLNLSQLQRPGRVSSDYASEPADESHHVHGPERSGREATSLRSRSSGVRVQDGGPGDDLLSTIQRLCAD